jgi:hypothetical protein
MKKYLSPTGYRRWTERSLFTSEKPRCACGDEVQTIDRVRVKSIQDGGRDNFQLNEHRQVTIKGLLQALPQEERAGRGDPTPRISSTLDHARIHLRSRLPSDLPYAGSMRPQAEDTHPVAKKMLMNLRPGAPRAGKLLMLLSANRTAHELAITRLLKPVLKYCSCIMLVCVFSAATRVAESPFAGSWKLIGDDHRPDGARQEWLESIHHPGWR